MKEDRDITKRKKQNNEIKKVLEFPRTFLVRAIQGCGHILGPPKRLIQENIRTTTLILSVMYA